MQGLISSEFGPIALLSAGHAEPLDDQAAQTAMTAVLHTSKGLVGLQISSIQPYTPGLQTAAADQPGVAASSQRPSLPGLLDHMIDKTRSFRLARPGSTELAPAKSGPLATQAPITKESFLLVRSSRVLRAIAARHVIRIGKHQNAHRLGDGTHAEWLVQIDDDLLPARSLGCMENCNADESEPWCVQLQGAEDNHALLVQAIEGLVEVTPKQIKKLRLDQQHSNWLILPDQPPRQILDPRRVQAAPPESSDAASPALPRPEHGDSICSASTHARATRFRSNVPSLLSIQAGPYQIAFPGEILGPVLGPLDAGAIHPERGARDLPVIDLPRALGCGGGEPARFGFIVKWGSRSVVLLCQSGSLSADQTGFSPPPALPACISDHIDGLRISNSRAELLIKNRLLQTDLKRLVKLLPREAFTGWTTLPQHAPDLRSDHA